MHFDDAAEQAGSVGSVQMLSPLLVGVISACIPLWSTRFASDVFVDAVDAAFVCFNIDLDIGNMRQHDIYEAFAWDGDAERV